MPLPAASIWCSPTRRTRTRTRAPRWPPCAQRDAIDERTTVVYEHSSRDAAPADPAMHVARTERYGEVALAFLHPVASAA